MATTLGRQLVKQILPQAHKSAADQMLTKKQVSKLVTKLAKQDPDQYIQILARLNHLGQAVVSVYGRDAALTLDDVDSGKRVKHLVQKFQQMQRKILNSDLSNEQKQKRITDIGYKYSNLIKDQVVADHKARKTSLYSQLISGSRGNPMQITQLNFGNLGVRDAMNRDIPYFGVSPYSAGALPFAYWVGASSSRKGFYDTQAITGQAGYLGKQASNATHNVPICMQDCGTKTTGEAVHADQDAVGAVLLRPYKKWQAGTVVTQDMIKDSAEDDELIVRSPLTCRASHGVCAKCSGLNEDGVFPSIGQYVALNAAKTFIQKATQSGVSSKHVGGTGGKKQLNPQGQDQPTGMPQLQRIFYVPSTFKGGAILSKVDGIVSSIKKAPQGGNYITVGETVVYAPTERTVRVSVGDKVTAGDRLTNGVPNPVDIVKYKGLGQGRKYFVKELDRTLKNNNWGVNKRNLQQFSRGFINKVQITDPDGFQSYLPGDVVDYSDVQNLWKPREDSKVMDVQKAKNMYLDQPVLHYTIGTRVTPEVINTLKKYKFDSVNVNDKEPPFRSVFIRSTDIVSNDANWMPRLMGQRLTASLFDAARKGITDRYDSPSYVDKVVAAPYKP